MNEVGNGRKRSSQEADREESKDGTGGVARRRLGEIGSDAASGDRLPEILAATIEGAQSDSPVDPISTQPPAESTSQEQPSGFDASRAESTGTVGQALENILNGAQGLPQLQQLQQQQGMGAAPGNQGVASRTNSIPNLQLLSTSTQSQGSTPAESPLAFAMGNQRSPINSMNSLLPLAPNNQVAAAGGLSLPILQLLSRNQAQGINPFLLQQRVSANQTMQSAAAAMAQLAPAFRAQPLTQHGAASNGLLLSLLTQPQQVVHGNFASSFPGQLNLPAAGIRTEVASAPAARGPESQAANSSASSNGMEPPNAHGEIQAAMGARSTSPTTPPTASDSDAILLYTAKDETKISPYQCLARQQLEFFVVGQAQLETGAQGRNRPIVLGQVGIRCKWCAKLPHRQKQRASTYFPAKLTGVYQTAQNITNSHLMQLCQCVPANIQRDLRLLQSKKSGTGGGRKYWTQSAIACGIDETERTGLRMREQEGGGGEVKDSANSKADSEV